MKARSAFPYSTACATGSFRPRRPSTGRQADRLCAGGSRRQRLRAAFDQDGAQPITVIRTINATTVCALVAEGIGVGFVTPYALAGLDLTRFAVKPFEPPVHSRSLLLLPIDRPKSLLVKAMIDCLMVSG
ncbi:LysR substrate-binding domain-containing protein [Bosea sp. NPDC055332]